MHDISFSDQELNRYSRHLSLSEFNLEGQRKLKAAKVLVVGAGGLGAPLLLYLAAAGVGTIGIVDNDSVEESNLQRQVLYGIDDLGKAKVDAASARLKNLNPHINIITYKEEITADNALNIIANYDVVADGTDNFPTRYLVNDACVLLDKCLVFASIHKFQGQVAVFHYLDKDGNRGPNYRDMYPNPPAPGSVPSCAEGGVLGVLPGIIGSMQANELIKVISGIGEPLSGKLFMYDALNSQSRILRISKDAENPLTGANPTQKSLINYQKFCGLADDAQEGVMKEISAEELRSWQQSSKDFQIIDVREKHEYELSNINGLLIPLGLIEESVNQIESGKDVVIHCASGMRSANAIKVLESKFGFKNLYNLKGGIQAYQNCLNQLVK